MKKSMCVLVMAALLSVACKNDKKTENTDTKGAQSTEMNMEHGDNDHGAMENNEMDHDNSDGHHDNDNATDSNERGITASTQKNGATSEIIESYLQIKNALVQDDKGKAAEASKMMLTAFSNFDMSSLKGDTHKEYMEILESAKEHAEHIVKSPIDHQREHLETLSIDVNDLVTLLGTDKTLYVDYCPMKKVSWLSETKDIKNPFYGSEMLTCGNVKKQIN